MIKGKDRNSNLTWFGFLFLILKNSVTSRFSFNITVHISDMKRYQFSKLGVNVWISLVFMLPHLLFQVQHQSSKSDYFPHHFKSQKNHVYFWILLFHFIMKHEEYIIYLRFKLFSLIWLTKLTGYSSFNAPFPSIKVQTQNHKVGHCKD